MEAVLPIFAEFGIPGLVIGFLVWSNSRKEDRIASLTDRLISKNEEDAQRFVNQTLTLERILSAVQNGEK